MRHRKKTVKLGRTSAHRDALLSGLVCNLIAARRITTTLPKAKAARSLADKMVTLAKKGTLEARRQAISTLRQQKQVGILFDELATQFSERAGGYTRIVKLGKRSGDNSEMAILEWVSQEGETAAEKPRKKEKKDRADQDA